jgi:hypothetical protein
MALNLSSPRPWGCFCVGTDYEVTRVVFPTPVGVFPPWPRPDSPESSLPHARGGVSGIVRVAQLPVESSPRPWGCFSAIASGAVSKVGLPHARGGVSDPRYPVWSLGLSSPRPWGCFRLDANWAAGDGVFPTPVGVFPKSHRRSNMWRCLPHARGGVSTTPCTFELLSVSSPRPWGCFLNVRPFQAHACVFPTPVGVFLSPVLIFKI